jgi:hypothetical protein
MPLIVNYEKLNILRVLQKTNTNETMLKKHTINIFWWQKLQELEQSISSTSTATVFYRSIQECRTDVY